MDDEGILGRLFGAFLLVLACGCSQRGICVDDAWLEAAINAEAEAWESGWECSSVGGLDSLEGKLTGPGGQVIEFSFESTSEGEEPKEWSPRVAYCSFLDDEVVLLREGGSQWRVIIWRENPPVVEVYSLVAGNAPDLRAQIEFVWFHGGRMVWDRVKKERGM